MAINPIYFYYPNLVGYARVMFMIFAFSVCFSDHMLAAVFYSISQGLDAVDGMTARAFNQCSKFGAVLDMLTDRMSTAVLLVVLALQYPGMWALFAFLIVLDIVSHWFQMYSKLAQQKTTHKGSKNPLLNFYYTFPYALLVHCVGNEAFLISLYLLSFPSSYTQYITLISHISFPIFCMKQFMNLVQLVDSANEIVELDSKSSQ